VDDRASLGNNGPGMASVENIPVQDVGALTNELRKYRRQCYRQHLLRTDEGDV
jgi:hypothetical protein